jgi:hypothetical protein
VGKWTYLFATIVVNTKILLDKADLVYSWTHLVYSRKSFL